MQKKNKTLTLTLVLLLLVMVTLGTLGGTFAKYTSSASQQTLINLQLGEISFEYNGELSTTFNESFIAEYERENYLEKYIEILQNSEDGYDPQYANWWTTMYQGGNE